jgi:hypothetical protein
MVKTVWFQLRQDQRKTLGNYDWIFVVKEIAGVIQVRARICKSLWSPGIDSEESTPPAYLAWRAGTTNMVIVPACQAGIDSWAP